MSLPFSNTHYGRVAEGEWHAQKNIPVEQKQGEPWWQFNDRKNAAEDYQKRNGQ